MRRVLAGAILALGLGPLAAYAAGDTVGVVVDKAAKTPIAGAYVFQPGSLNGVLTDAAGKFRLKLDPKYGTTLQVTRESYEPLIVTPSGDTTQVALSPVTSFQPFVAVQLPAGRQPALDSVFNLHYQMAGFNAGSGTGAISGMVTNQLVAAGQFRLGNLLVKGEGMRNRIPVDVAGFPFKPTVNFDTWQARLGGGYVFQLGTPAFEAYIGPEYLVNFVQPDNRSGSDAKPIPYTNTFMDRFPLRQALGANAVLGFRPFGPLALSVEGTYSPVVFSAVEPGTEAIGGLQHWSFGARADYALAVGVGVGVAYRHTGWMGALRDDQDIVAVGLNFNPWRIGQ